MSREAQKIQLTISAATVFKIVALLGLCALIFILRDLILVILTAIVVASSVEPVTHWFMRHRVPRLPAVIIIYATLALLLVGVFYYLLIPVLGEGTAFVSSLPQVINQSSMQLSDSGFVQSEPLLKNLSDSINDSNISEKTNAIISQFSGGFWNSINFVFGGAIGFLIIMVLSFYLAVQDDGVGKFLRIITPRKKEKYVLDLWHRVEVKIGLWMQGQLVLALIVGVLVYLGLLLLGVENALFLAVLAGMFELIPLFGPILAAIPAIALSFVSGGLSLAVMVTGFYVLIQQFENHLIYPLIVKKVVGISPIVVIIALIAGAQLGGFLGLLLSVPVAAIIMEFISDLEQQKTPAE